MIGWFAGALFVVICGVAAAYAAVRRTQHVGEHVRFIWSDTEPGVRLWYCTRCGDSGSVDADAVNSGGFLHSAKCSPPV